MDPNRDAQREHERSGARIRAFFALALDAAPRRAAAACTRALSARPGGDGVRWVREENLHVTLRFLGNVDPARVPDLMCCVRAETRRVGPFCLRLGSTGWFPSERHPRVVALGLEPPVPVESLADAVERGVVAAGFPPEARPFHAHLTLGRVAKRSARRLDVTGSDTGETEAWSVTEAVLFRSELQRSGARYTPLECAPLGAAGGSDHP
ncbi:MAG: RNA 2',3'-cyclic phosphodiesterase [Myxococcales bacterium]|nr:RNA 2',3'-cyclic phosphodiesterase [Myxococcales bacterium]MDH5567021.1 RNA 2',3'-cyclic phosphodiesterase [Myxococcales bacterium]